MNVNGKKILVLGLMRSGIAVSELLIQHGAKLILCDQKDSTELRLKLENFNNRVEAIHLGSDPSLYLYGVDMLVISPGVPIDSNIVKQANKKNIRVLGELEVAAAFNKSMLLAVSGTNGKTTSVSLLGRILQNAGKISWVAGNVGYPMSLAVMNSKQDDIIVAEVSSFQLETISTFHPAIAALLNITEDHLNRHGTMDEYIRLKFRLFENQADKDIAVLNYDDAIIRENAKNIKSQILWFSRTQELDIGAFVDSENMLTVKWDGKIKQIININDINIPGPHNLENALAMAAIAVAMKIPSAVIRHTLITFEGVEHRIESVAIKNGIKYINDSKGTNVESTIKAVNTMKVPTTIILGGYDKKTDFKNLCITIKDSNTIKHAVLIGQTAKQIEKCLKEVGFNNIIHATTLEDAVAKAGEVSEDGYNVLLSPACASFDMFVDYEERGRIFKNIVNKI